MEGNRPTIIERIFETRTAQKARSLMQSRYGTSLLALISFFESLLPLPILTDPFLAAAIMLDRTRVWRLVIVTMVSSVVGGVTAYFIAVFFRDVLLTSLSPELLATLHSLVAQDTEETFLLTVMGAVTPIPYTIVAWAIAVADGNPLIFILGSIVGRSLRYGIVGWCTYKFGPTALTYAKRSILLTSIAIFILIGIYIWLKM